MPRKTLLLICAVVCTLTALAPAGARAAGTGTGTGKLRLVLPLAANTQGLERYAAAVADPASSLFHHYRSIAWLSARYGAPSAARSAVVGYLRAHGASRVRLDATGLFVDATLSRATAQAMFSTRLTRRGSRADAFSAPSTRVTIPAALSGLITGVTGLDTRPVLAAPALTRSAAATGSGLNRGLSMPNAFDSLSAPITRTAAVTDPGSGYLQATGTMAGCGAARSVDGFTPNQYLTAYGYDPLHGTNILGQGERVALIEVDGFKRSDITTFAKCFGLTVPKIVAFRTDNSVTTKGLAPGGESTLDLEVLTAAAPALHQIDVYESSADISSALQAITAPLQNSGYKPDVISASLGLCEPQIRDAIGLGGLRNTEAALAEASASGISVLAASGDDGSADCVDTNSDQGLPQPKLAVNFPASSPFVTAVGGTNLALNPDNTIAAQDVWNDDAASPGSAGGGGYSTVFARPTYQAAVNSLNHRALPDVAMLADIAPGYDVYCSARPACVTNLPGMTHAWQAVGGTSASTPLLAGGLALIDQELRAHQQQGLGLVNPLLYALGTNAAQNPLVFSDVSTGSNDVGPFIRKSAAPLGCCTAVAGFDAASGWGSVNLGNLSTAALAATPALVSVSETLNTQQSPVRAGAVYARIGCSGRCELGAVATISIPGAAVRKFYSGLYHLTAGGSRVVRIGLPAAYVQTLRGALNARRRITASVVGAIVDPAGNVERQTPPQTFTISR